MISGRGWFDSGVGVGAGQEQEAETDEGEDAGQGVELGEVVGPDLHDRDPEQCQAGEPDVGLPADEADDDGAEAGHGPEGRQPGLTRLARFAEGIDADGVDDRDRAEVDEKCRAGEGS
jgi:hypothetical protein